MSLIQERFIIFNNLSYFEKCVGSAIRNRHLFLGVYSNISTFLIALAQAFS